MHSDTAPYNVLDTTLNNILTLIKPDSNDLLRRFQAVADIRSLVQSVSSLNGATVSPFGSYVSNLFTKWGDIDISIQLSEAPSSVHRSKKRNLLRDIMRALSSRGWGYCMFIPQAKVPVLVFQSRLRNVSCDISIDNHWGLVKSKIFHLISNLDARFREIVLLIKEWAKAKNVNNPKAGTLSSYSICLLIIFHFQTCSPPIFPPLKDIYGGNLLNDFTGRRFTSLKAVEDLCSANIERISHMYRRNHSSLRELLISFFQKFSGLKNLAHVYGICTYSGQYEPINDTARWRNKFYKLTIEDPFEVPENAGRTVGTVGLIVISEAFDDTQRKLSSPSLLSDKNSILNVLLSSRGLSHWRLMS